MQEPVGGAAERDPPDHAAMRRAEDEEARAARLGALVQHARRRRPGDGGGLDGEAVERGLDGMQAGHGVAAQFVDVVGVAERAGRVVAVDGDGKHRCARGAREQGREDRAVGVVAHRVDADEDGRVVATGGLMRPPRSGLRVRRSRRGRRAG